MRKITIIFLIGLGIIGIIAFSDYKEAQRLEKQIQQEQLETLKSEIEILKNKKPIYVGETEDIKNDILEKFIKNNSPFLAELKKNDDISIAYSIIKNQNERSKLKSYLQNIYKISTISQTSP